MGDHSEILLLYEPLSVISPGYAQKRNPLMKTPLGAGCVAAICIELGETPAISSSAFGQPVRSFSRHALQFSQNPSVRRLWIPGKRPQRLNHVSTRHNLTRQIDSPLYADLE